MSSSPSFSVSPSLEPSRDPGSLIPWFPDGEGASLLHGRFATILIVVLCLLVVALSIVTIVHYRSYRSRAVGAPQPPPSSPQVPSLPAQDFSVGLSLVGTGLDCSICLSEFVSGEKVTVLPCNHGFHLSCIQRWFACSSTCPTCRTSFSSPPPAPEENV